MAHLKVSSFFVITKARNEVSMKALELRHASAKSPSNFKYQDEVVKQLVKLLEGMEVNSVFPASGHWFALQSSQIFQLFNP